MNPSETYMVWEECRRIALATESILTLLRFALAGMGTILFATFMLIWSRKRR